MTVNTPKWFQQMEAEGANLRSASYDWTDGQLAQQIWVYNQVTGKWDWIRKGSGSYVQQGATRPPDNAYVDPSHIQYLPDDHPAKNQAGDPNDPDNIPNNPNPNYQFPDGTTSQMEQAMGHHPNGSVKWDKLEYGEDSVYTDTNATNTRWTAKKVVE